MLHLPSVLVSIIFEYCVSDPWEWKPLIDLGVFLYSSDVAEGGQTITDEQGFKRFFVDNIPKTARIIFLNTARNQCFQHNGKWWEAYIRLSDFTAQWKQTRLVHILGEDLYSIVELNDVMTFALLLKHPCSNELIDAVFKATTWNPSLELLKMAVRRYPSAINEWCASEWLRRRKRLRRFLRDERERLNVMSIKTAVD